MVEQGSSRLKNYPTPLVFFFNRCRPVYAMSILVGLGVQVFLGPAFGVIYATNCIELFKRGPAENCKRTLKTIVAGKIVPV